MDNIDNMSRCTVERSDAVDMVIRDKLNSKLVLKDDGEFKQVLDSIINIPKEAWGETCP